MAEPGARLPAYRELRGRSGAPDGSSWGLWGESDVFGTLNLLGADQVLTAAAEIREGRVFSLNASLTEFDPPLFGRDALAHEIQAFSGGRTRDETLGSFNTQSSTQWDGFRHVRSSQHGFYNGLDEDRLSIEDWAYRGIVGCGVLLDAERWFAEAGRPIDHAEAFGIGVEDLEAMVAALPEPLREGDVLVLHTGWLDHVRRAGGRLDSPLRTPGLAPSEEMVAYLWDTRAAAVVSDTPALEVWPPGALVSDEVREQARRQRNDDPRVFMHYRLIPLLGLVIGELFDTGELAAACRASERSRFFFSGSPLALPGGVASPANSLAVL